MKESTTINIKVLARRVPPDYTSESLIIYNHVTNEKAFIGEEIRKQGIIVTETCSFSLCTRGEAEIMINTQNYRIKKNHLIIMLPKQVIKRFIQHRITRRGLFSFRQTILKRSAKK